MKIITDNDVRQLPASEAVNAARESLRQFGRHELTAPPRVRSELGAIDYVYTAGAMADGTSGFRAYRSGQPAGDQMVAVWDPNGRLSGLVIGQELGVRRTGALGAVAADALARADAATVAVIGSGVQAWAQLWALSAVRPLKHVMVHSPTAQHREDFAARTTSELGIDATAVATPAAALHTADIVIMSTRSTTPVFDAADIAPGTHVTTVGPKSSTAHEAPLELSARATLVTCDSPEQAAAYPEPFFTGDLPLVSLADILIGRVPGRQAEDEITLHCSVGLAGSEIVLAQRLLAATS